VIDDAAELNGTKTIGTSKYNCPGTETDDEGDYYSIFDCMFIADT
jgi:hypothetical protein